MKIRLCFFLLSLSFSSLVLSQGAEELLCKILDAETGYPVSYATIQFANSNNGLIADEEGNFRLPARYKQNNASLIISSIGFETKTVKASELRYTAINTMYLKPRVETLDAVVIIAKSTSNGSETFNADKIIKEAITNISINYPKVPHSYISYYRDYQVVNNNYYNLNEAILESFDNGFNTDKYVSPNNTSVLYFYELNQKFYQDSLLLNAVYGESKALDKDKSAIMKTTSQNELEILNIHNPIRNYNKNSFSFIYVFRNDFAFNHNFKLERVQYIEDTPLYEISFVSKNSEYTKFFGQGTIYISKDNFAIHKINYSLYENTNFKAIQSGFSNNSNSRRGADNHNVDKETIFQVTIEYKRVNDLMYLNYMTFNNRFIINDTNPFKVEAFEFNPEDENFYITFNKPIDKKSISRKTNYRLRYKTKKLVIQSAEMYDENTIKVTVLDWAAGVDAELTQVKPADFSYKLKRIKDVSGGELNKTSILMGYQFRELFTQQVFEEKTKTKGLQYVDKTLPLFASKVNATAIDIEKYWINSPLKQTRTK